MKITSCQTRIYHPRLLLSGAHDLPSGQGFLDGQAKEIYRSKDGRTSKTFDANVLPFYTNSEYIIIENCTVRDASFGATVTAGNTIVHNNHFYDLTSDGISYDGGNILITGNLIHNNLASGTSQHCDFFQSNQGAYQVVMRNNTCYNGDHQWLKWVVIPMADTSLTPI